MSTPQAFRIRERPAQVKVTVRVPKWRLSSLNSETRCLSWETEDRMQSQPKITKTKVFLIN